MTGKPGAGGRVCAGDVAHSETVLRGFYDFHRDAGSGPILNPFPLDLSRRSGARMRTTTRWTRWRARAGWPLSAEGAAADSPGDPRRAVQRAVRARCRRTGTGRWWRSGSPQGRARRSCSGAPAVRHRPRPAADHRGAQGFSRGAAGARVGGRVRLAAACISRSCSARVPRGPDQPLWWTLRRPRRPLTYHAAHRMFERANATLGADWTLHDLRHSAATRMAHDPQLTLSDVQWVLGPRAPDHDRAVLHARQGRGGRRGAGPSRARRRTYGKTGASTAAPGYDPQSLSVLFGRAL